MSQVLEYAKTHREDIVRLLQELVEHESPSSSKEACDGIISFVEARLKPLGLSTERVPQKQWGDQLLARWGSAEVKGDQRQALVLCHLDTVWPIGTIKERPFRRDDKAVYGPGVYDMKGGAAAAVSAIQTLKALGLKPSRPLTLLFNTDEEVGSPSSRPLIEQEARNSALCFCMEPGEPPGGRVKTARKGVGIFFLKVTGRASHAGQNPWAGVNAIGEMAHQILRLHGMTDRETGTTVNVGIVRGGVVRNMIPPSAEAEIDVRVVNNAEAERITKAIFGLTPVLPGASLEVTGGINRPPMERTPAIASLFQKARAIAREELGLELKEGATGGGSDGQLAAATGCPTLDGLGMVGNGGHAVTEHTMLHALPERTALLATLLLKL